MRTVHETEALRPSDPVPKSMQSGPASKGKLKIIIKTPQSHAAGQDDSMNGGDDDTELSADHMTPLTEDQGFTADELAMPLERLYKLCRFQIKWASDETKNLHDEIKRWEEEYKKEWQEKEVLLAQVIQSEVDWNERRQAVLSGAADVRLDGVHDGPEISAGGGANSTERPSVADGEEEDNVQANGTLVSAA